MLLLAKNFINFVMDDDVFLANNLPISNDINARTHPAQHDNMLLTDTVGIFVEAEWGSATQTGIQLCPAVFIPSAAQIPRAVKHIYRHEGIHFRWGIHDFQSIGGFRRGVGPGCSGDAHFVGWHRKFIQF